MERLRWAAVVEASTYLVLVVAMVVGRTGVGPDIVGAVGLLHGSAFLLYAAAVLRCRGAMRWTAQETVTLLAAAFVPGGTIIAERRLSRSCSGRPTGVGALA